MVLTNLPSQEEKEEEIDDCCCRYHSKRSNPCHDCDTLWCISAVNDLGIGMTSHFSSHRNYHDDVDPTTKVVMVVNAECDPTLQ